MILTLMRINKNLKCILKYKILPETTDVRPK